MSWQKGALIAALVLGVVCAVFAVSRLLKKKTNEAAAFLAVASVV